MNELSKRLSFSCGNLINCIWIQWIFCLRCSHSSAPFRIFVTFLNLNFQKFKWHARFYVPKAQRHDGPTYEIEYFFLAVSWKHSCQKVDNTQHINAASVRTHIGSKCKAISRRGRKKSNSLLVCCHGWCQHLHIPESFYLLSVSFAKANCSTHTRRKRHVM